VDVLETPRRLHHIAGDGAPVRNVAPATARSRETKASGADFRVPNDDHPGHEDFNVPIGVCMARDRGQPLMVESVLVGRAPGTDGVNQTTVLDTCLWRLAALLLTGA